MIIVALGLLLAAVFFFLKATQSILVRVIRIARANEVRPHRVWVGALSPSSWRWSSDGMRHQGKGVAQPLPAGDIHAAVAAMSRLTPASPWEQILRGLTPHVPRLERVVLLTSEGPKGTDVQFDEC